MFYIAAAVLILCSYAGRIRCQSSIEPVSANVSQSCAVLETECALGCCPFQDGVCCLDGFECCEHGKTCIPFIGICIGDVNNHGEIALTSDKSTRVRSNVLKCPSRTTECAPDKCCIYERAVCCPDGEHCCPNGFRCDSPSKLCIRDTTNEITKNTYNGPIYDKPVSKMSRKSSYKSCPGGGGRMCPSYMSCCIHDNGEWGCCPNPSLPEIRYGAGGCCQSMWGFICCPDLFPLCTVLGCL